MVTFSALLPVAVPVVPTGASGDVSDARPAAAPPPRIECRSPPSLRLHRFEDGSAQLRCAGRVIVRIAVPG